MSSPYFTRTHKDNHILYLKREETDLKCFIGVIYLVKGTQFWILWGESVHKCLGRVLVWIRVLAKYREWPIVISPPYPLKAFDAGGKYVILPQWVSFIQTVTQVLGVLGRWIGGMLLLGYQSFFRNDSGLGSSWSIISWCRWPCCWASDSSLMAGVPCEKTECWHLWCLQRREYIQWAIVTTESWKTKQPYCLAQ